MTTPPVYIINLRRRQDRLTKIVKRLESIGFTSIHPVEAVDGTKLVMNPWLDKMFAGNDFGSRRSIIGCACSHYFLWKHIAEDESIKSHVLILEDDCHLVDNAATILATNADVIATKQFVYLGVTRVNPFPLSLAPVDSISFDPLDKSVYYGGFFAYMIDRATARAMVDFCDTHGIKYGIDVVIPLESTISTCVVHPPLAHSPIALSTNAVDTDIQRDYSSLPISHLTRHDIY
jgi:GR25 family glycosyltransferase involved in LPS biosynthesis